MGVGKGRRDMPLNPVVWRKIGHIGGISPAGTTGEDTIDASLAVSDDGPRIPGRRESVILVTVRVDGNLNGYRANSVVIVFPDEGFDADTTTDGDSGGVAILEDGNTLFAVLLSMLRSSSSLTTSRNWRRPPCGYLKGPLA